MRISKNIQNLNYDTPYWDFRVFTEKEKFEWNMNGVDMAEAAFLMKEYAKRKNIDREDFEIIFSENYRSCFEKMKNLEMSVWDCAETKDLLTPWDRIYYGTIVRFRHFYSALLKYL
jgi:hypothetical protein